MRESGRDAGNYLYLDELWWKSTQRSSSMLDVMRLGLLTGEYACLNNESKQLQTAIIRVCLHVLF